VEADQLRGEQGLGSSVAGSCRRIWQSFATTPNAVTRNPSRIPSDLVIQGKARAAITAQIMDMHYISREDLPDGSPVLVEFLPGILSIYGEPKANLFDPQSNQPLTFPRGSILEAYGFDPRSPDRTPVPFWGDHYIRKKTVWYRIKQFVNRDVFLTTSANRRFEAVLYHSRARKYPKFICEKYHRHLNRSYEVIWALIQSLRAYQKSFKKPISRINDSDLTLVYENADLHHEEKGVLAYREIEFLRLLPELEKSGLAPQHQPLLEELKNLLAGMFERVVADFVRNNYGYDDVRQALKPPFLSGEVDLYARFDRGKVLRVIVGSCKLRLEKPPLSVRADEVQNLLTRLAEAMKAEKEYSDSRGKSFTSVTGMLFTNADSAQEDALILAKQHSVSIAHIKLPRAWDKDPTRHDIDRSMVKFLSGNHPKWIPKQDSGFQALRDSEGPRKTTRSPSTQKSF
jgi:hypothetical protein